MDRGGVKDGNILKLRCDDDCTTKIKFIELKTKVVKK